MKRRLAILLSLSIISTTMTTPYMTVAEEFTDEVISEGLPAEEAVFEDVFTDENVGNFEGASSDNMQENSQENPEEFVVVDEEMQAAEAKIHGLVYNAAAVQTGQHQLNITEADGWAVVKFTPDVSGRYSLALGDPSRARMYIAEGIDNAISSWGNDDCHDGEMKDIYSYFEGYSDVAKQGTVYNLKADTTYYIKVRFTDAAATGTISCSLVKEKEVVSVKCLTKDEDYINSILNPHLSYTNVSIRCKMDDGSSQDYIYSSPEWTKSGFSIETIDSGNEVKIMLKGALKDPVELYTVKKVGVDEYADQKGCTVLSEGVFNDFVLKKGERKHYLKFTPKTTGQYTLDLSGDRPMYRYMSYTNEGIHNNSVRNTFDFEAGKTYYICFDYGYASDTDRVTSCKIKLAAKQVEEGKEVALSSEEEILYFTPIESGKYNLRFGKNAALMLYGADNSIVSGQTFYDTKVNLKTVELTGKKQYKICVSQSNRGTDNAKLYIEKTSPIKDVECINKGASGEYFLENDANQYNCKGMKFRLTYENGTSRDVVYGDVDWCKEGFAVEISDSKAQLYKNCETNKEFVKTLYTVVSSSSADYYKNAPAYKSGAPLSEYMEISGILGYGDGVCAKFIAPKTGKYELTKMNNAPIHAEYQKVGESTKHDLRAYDKDEQTAYIEAKAGEEYILFFDSADAEQKICTKLEYVTNVCQHSFKKVRDQLGTCVQPEKSHMECTKCEKEYEVEPEFDFTTEYNHETMGQYLYESYFTVDKEATCTDEGEESIHCKYCDKIKPGSKHTIEAAGHKFGSWKTTKKATALKEGKQTRECSECEDTETKSIEKLKATGKVNMETVKLQKGKTTTKFKVSDLAYGDKVKSYSSSNKKIFTVNSSGKIYAKTKGTAKLTVTLASGKKLTATVKVYNGIVKTTKISVNTKSVTLKKGKSEQLKTTVTPLTSQEKVTYKSSKTSVATVSSSGKIIAKAKGTAYITVKSGSKTTKVKVVVK